MASGTANKQLFSKVLAADVAGHEFHKIHEYAGYALAGATPVAVVSNKGSFLSRTSDLVFTFAIPVHSHISLNALVTDYLPNKFKGAARGGVLGLSAITFLGLAKLNLFGPGLTATVKNLWQKPEKQK